MKKRFLFTSISAVMASTAMIAASVTNVAAGDDDGPLSGFVRTGETKSCINLASINEIRPVTDELFLVRVGVNRYYLNEVSGSCNGASRGFNRLQYKTSLSTLCNNQIIRVVDNSQGFTVGSCALGSFERLEVKPAEDETSDS